MCTYHLTFSDSLLEGAKRTFPNQAAITSWMEQQIERMLLQMSVDENTQGRQYRKVRVSERIKALSMVPPTSSHADYKDDLIDVLSEKY